MKENQTNINNNEDSVDILTLLKNIWSYRKFVIKTTISFFIIGCIVALTSPIIYTSQTTFIPQVSEKGLSPSKSLGAIASLAGININESTTSLDSYVSPLLYTNITNSDEFSLSLINEELILLNNDKILIKDYMSMYKKNFNLIGFVHSIFNFIKKYTFGLFISNNSNNNNSLKSQIKEDYNFITEDDYNLVKEFKQKFLIEVNKKEGYIKVVGLDKNAFVSTQIVKLVTKNLQSKIITLRTKKIKEQLDYSKLQYEEQKIFFENLQNDLAEFKDSNKNISTAVFLSQLQKLESEYQLQQSILMTLASEYNNNKIKLNKDTPIFSVLDEVSVPNERTEPQRTRIVFIYMFTGLVLSLIYVTGKDSLKELVDHFK
tara:strand:- start:3577 stop:4698 length:1122 start_codon:yes stop_codon:yes gene_type:complete